MSSKSDSKNIINPNQECLKNSQVYSIKEVEQKLSTNIEDGLTNEQVKQSINKYGKNVLVEKKKQSIFMMFLNQFKDVMTIILLVAALISFIPLFIPGVESDVADWAQPFIILLIVLLNASIGLIQNIKSNKAVESLKQMTESQSKVIRNGITLTIPSSEVVVGDIIVFEMGDKIPADARLIEANNLKTIESSLTGESTSIEKNANTIWKDNTPLGDRTNMVYSSCMVVDGSGKAIVTGIGMASEIGHIASMIQEHKPEKTPLQKQIAKFGKWLSIFCVFICIVVFGLQLANMWTQIVAEPYKIIFLIMIAVSLAVAVIPEGLPIAITIIMSLGVVRMAKENAIVKNLASVETLGSASIICSDKTGTLTQNKMTVIKTYDNKLDKEFVISKSMDQKNIDLLTYATLCCNATYDNSDGAEHTSGDPTEIAIIKALNDLSIKQNDINDLYPQVNELPFDSTRKLMTSVNKISNDKYIVITKGAIDQLVEKCINSKQEIEHILAKNKEWTSNGERVIGVGIKYLKTKPNSQAELDKLESGLEFIGMMAMIDPIRENVKLSIDDCIKGGIKVIMITGDHVLTAKHIGQELGIFNDGDLAITGAELDAMSDEEFSSKIERISVYARVSPENKLRIVKKWQELNKVVAMTGDGVNDAPALKQAEIGCAMGITGTDVSKDAADVILADDNFSTIVKAVKQGRNIYNNILKVINFLLATNFGEVIAIIAILIFSWNDSSVYEPFSAIQILWINMLTDSPPAIALGLEPTSRQIMFEKPRDAKKSIFSNGLLLKICLESFMIGIIMTGAFYMGYYCSSDLIADKQKAGSTLAFLTLIIGQLTHIFCLKSKETIFKTKINNNKFLVYTVAIAIGLTLLVSLIPSVADVFNMTTFYNSTDWVLYLYCFLLSFLGPLVFMEIEKLVINKCL